MSSSRPCKRVSRKRIPSFASEASTELKKIQLASFKGAKLKEESDLRTMGTPHTGPRSSAELAEPNLLLRSPLHPPIESTKIKSLDAKSMRQWVKAAEETFNPAPREAAHPYLRAAQTAGTRQSVMSVEGTPGENRLASLQDLMDLLSRHFCLSKDSVFLDIGSGRGFPSLLAHIYVGVKCSMGIEMDEGSYIAAIDLLTEVLWDFASSQILQENETAQEILLTPGRIPSISFIRGDAVLLDSFTPVTHIYSFDLAMPTYMIDRFVRLFEESTTAVVYVSFRNDLQYTHLMDAELLASTPMEMAGSGERHTAFIYVKRSFISQLPLSAAFLSHRKTLGPTWRVVTRTPYQKEDVIGSTEATNCKDPSVSPTTIFLAPDLIMAVDHIANEWKHFIYQHSSVRTVKGHTFSIRESYCCRRCGLLNKLPYSWIADSLTAVEDANPVDFDYTLPTELSSLVHLKKPSKAATTDQWVQCTRCDRWRRLPHCTPEEFVALKKNRSWACEANRWDCVHQSCLIPQEDDSSQADDPSSLGKSKVSPSVKIPVLVNAARILRMTSQNIYGKVCQVAEVVEIPPLPDQEFFERFGILSAATESSMIKSGNNRVALSTFPTMKECFRRSQLCLVDHINQLQRELLCWLHIKKKRLAPMSKLGKACKEERHTRMAACIELKSLLIDRREAELKNAGWWCGCKRENMSEQTKMKPI